MQYGNVTTTVHLNLVLQDRVRVEPVEELVGGHVKGRDDLLRVAHQLRVEVREEAMEVVAVDVQEGLL